MQEFELEELRDEIDQLDKELLTILAKRKAIVKKVGAYKSKHGVSIVAPDREMTLIAKRREQAKQLDISPDLIESILKRVMLSSYQNESSIQFKKTNPDIKSILIVGGQGQMGQLFSRFFRQSGYEVNSLDKQDWDNAEELCANADCIILSVPIHLTHDIINKLPVLKSNCLLTDLTSIKHSPVETMLQKHQGPVIGLHPMFGPDVNNFAKQVIISCPGRDEKKFNWLLGQFQLWGASIKKINSQDHDKKMSVIQALRHFSTLCFGINLYRENLDMQRLLELSSPIYRIEITMVARLFAQDPDLYLDIILSNPKNLELIKRFANLTNELINMLETCDRLSIINLFKETQAYFGDYATTLMNESREIIQSMVHHQGKK